MIRANSSIKGIEGGGKEHKLMLYADDILLLIKDPVHSLPPLMDTNQTYSDLSGYKINWSKSEAPSGPGSSRFWPHSGGMNSLLMSGQQSHCPSFAAD